MTEQDRCFQILLVEDNPVDVLVTRQALREWKIDYRLHVLKNGQEALDFLLRRGDYVEAERPDLLLLDLNLPQKSGKEVLADIKQNPDLSNIPVVVVTTSDAARDIQMCHDFGAKLFVTKPIDFEEYIQVINSIQEFCFPSIATDIIPWE